MIKTWNLNKFNIKRSLSFVIFFCIFLIIISPLTIVVYGSFLFTPAPPNGPTISTINVENYYCVNTTEVGSSWMFDWGEGNFSDWIEFSSFETNISQNYTWVSYGVYEVRVKHRSIFFVESSWSDPLIVSILQLPDLDGDGYKNELEKSYGTNPDDPNEYPIDTDGDGIPDQDSPDNVYTGDSDDDNDGVTDQIEERIGSNSKYSDDISLITLKETLYIAANTNSDEGFDILYNVQTEQITNIKTINGKSYLDINGDKRFDYIYYHGSLTIYEEPFEIPWLYILIAIICTMIIILFIMFKKGILFLYH